LVNPGLNFQFDYCITNLILEGWTSLDPLKNKKNMYCRDWNLEDESQTLMACLDSHLRSSFLCGTTKATMSCFNSMPQKSRVFSSSSPIFANVSRSIRVQV